MMVYHGTNKSFRTPKLANAKSFRDFGPGYYTVVEKELARHWAEAMVARYGGEEIFIYEYYADVYEPGLKIKRFDFVTDEYLKLLKKGRTKENLSHEYDIVIAPVCDDNIMKIISAYVSGIEKSAATLEKLKNITTTLQVSLHTPKALKRLTARRREDYAK
ncbi:MAG: DUF3990 domain-containing protein [Endomicrobia bacterium]|nr:DUF3990 domain-containing protein [Endomicrobiia bacterium]MCL2507436.1 DUF3990 domain-containing protein [Endomicrobiia bacterium]